MTPELIIVVAEATDEAVAELIALKPPPATVVVNDLEVSARLISTLRTRMAVLATSPALAGDADGMAHLDTAVTSAELALDRQLIGENRSLIAAASDRHTAMEKAEAGCDAVLFDVTSDEGRALLTWWADVAQTPMIARTQTTDPDQIVDSFREAAKLRSEFFAFPMVEHVTALHATLHGVHPSD